MYKTEKLIHICHVLSTFGVGGLENGVVNLINYMDPEHFHHTLLCLYETGPMVDRIKNTSTQVIALNGPNRIAPELTFKISRILRSIRPDIVHTRNYTANLYGTIGARFSGSKKIINSEHGSIQMISWRRQLASRLVAQFATRILCVSNGLKLHIVKNLNMPTKKIDVIKNGVDTRIFDGRIQKKEARRRLNIPSDVFLVGTVGRFHEVKDHPSLLDFLQAINNVDGKEVHGLIIGGGELESEFKKKVRDRGLNDRIHLPGKLNNMHKIYPAFDIFLQLSSGNEGTSNVILEAMSSKVPVVVTAIEGNTAIIKDGWNGCLIRRIGEDKIRDLCRLIPYLLKNEIIRNKLVRNGCTMIENKFSINRMVQNYTRFYRSVLMGK